MLTRLATGVLFILVVVKRGAFVALGLIVAVEKISCYCMKTKKDDKQKTANLV